MTARAEIRRRRGSLLLLALFVGLAGAAVHTTLAASFRARSSFDRFESAAPQANIDIDLGDVEGTPALVRRLARLPGVEGVALNGFVAVIPDGQGVPFVDGISFTRVARAGVNVGGDVGVSGRDLDPSKPDEVVLNPAMADALGKGPGDSLLLASLTPESAVRLVNGEDVTEADGPKVRVRVAGIRRIPEDVSDAPDPILVVSPALAARDDLWGFAGLMVVRATPGRVDQVVESLGRELPGATVTPAAEFGARIQRGLDVQGATLLAVAAAALVAGIAGITQAVYRLVQSTRTDDDVRRVLGMTRGQRVAASVLGVLPLALVAGALAFVGGIVAGPWAITGLAEQAESDPGMWLDPVVAVGVAVGVVVLVLVAAVLPSGVRRPEAARVRAADRSGLGTVTTSLGVRRALGGGANGWAGRSALVAAVLAVATVAGDTTFTRSIDALLTEPARWAADFDAVGLAGESPDAVQQIADRLEGDERVEAVAEGRRVDVIVRRPGGPARSAEAVSTSSLLGSIQPWSSTDGEVLRSDRDALIGQQVMDQTGVAVGDELDVTIKGQTTRVRVVGTAVAYGTDQMDEGIVVAPSLTGAVAGSLEDRYALIRYAPGSGGDRLRAELSERSGVELQAVEPPSIIERLKEIGSLPFLLLAFVAALGVLAVGHALIASVQRSRRELATLRALGMTRGQVGRIIVVQALTVAIVGLAVGVPLGVAAGRQAFGIVDRGIGALGPPVASVAGVCSAILGALVVALLLAGLASLRIRPFGWAPDLRGE